MSLYKRLGGGFGATFILVALGIGAALFSGVGLMLLMNWRPDGPMIYTLASLAVLLALRLGIEIWGRTKRSR